jgi:hypothetical protein
MHRAVLFLILTFSLYTAAQSRGTTSVSTTGTSGAASAPNVSPGMSGQPASGPASIAPTTNLGPSTAQPMGTGQLTTGSAGITNSGTVSTGGFITNGAIGGGYVPLLQTPEAGFPSGLSTSLPNNPAGISNMPSALQYANTPSNEGVFNTGAADFGVSAEAADTRSLGDVARDYRAQRGGQQAGRVFTNADIDRMNQNHGPAALSSNLGPQQNAQPTANQPPAPSSPTTPAVNNNPAQPGQNQNLPGSEAQPR